MAVPFADPQCSGRVYRGETAALAFAAALRLQSRRHLARSLAPSHAHTRTHARAHAHAHTHTHTHTHTRPRSPLPQSMGGGCFVAAHWRRGDRAHAEMGDWGKMQWELMALDRLVSRLLGCACACFVACTPASLCRRFRVWRALRPFVCARAIVEAIVVVVICPLSYTCVCVR